MVGGAEDGASYHVLGEVGGCGFGATFGAARRDIELMQHLVRGFRPIVRGHGSVRKRERKENELNLHPVC